jgi:hypothetical protein
MQQVALLRRCFFPRRDVIRWVQCWWEKDTVFEVDFSVESIVNEPLKSLCVEGSPAADKATQPVLR